MPESDSDTSASATLLADDEPALAEAVQRARARDHAAFEYLYQRYKAPIWKRLVYFIGEKEVSLLKKSTDEFLRMRTTSFCCQITANWSLKREIFDVFLLIKALQ